MRYRVEVAARAKRDIRAAHQWIAAESPLNAARWLEGLEQAVSGLAQFPRRCPLAPESNGVGFEVRQFSFEPYRVLFTIDPPLVRILHVRHSGRRPVTRADLSARN